MTRQPLLSPSRLLLGLLLVLLLAACAPVQPEVDSGAQPAGETKTLFVNSERVPCMGVTPMMCLQVRESEQADWQFFYSGIDGFRFVPGFKYELVVNVTRIENPPADASSLLYTLVEVVSKTPANADAEVSLEGTTWLLRAFGEEAIVFYDETIHPVTLLFGEDGSLSGSAGCNRIIGGFSVAGSTVTFPPLGTTMMMCDDAAMAVEAALLAALDGDHEFTISGDMLQIVYAAGMLTFQAQPEETGDIAAAGPLPLEGTEWTLTSMDEAMGAPFNAADMKVTAFFDGERVAGGSGCNRYGGAYTIDGDTITFGMMISTMMACEEAQMAVEFAFLQAIQAGPSTVAIDGSTLTLTTPNGVLLFSGAAPASADTLTLTGAEWTLISMDESTGVHFDPNTVSVTMLFAEEGNVSGSAGCNRFNGGYTDEGASLTFTPFATTRMMCPDAQMAVETAFLAALQGSVQYTLDGNTLTLTTPTGVLVLEGAPLAAAATDAAAATSLPFFGTLWTLQSFDSNMNVPFDPAVVSVTATFGDDLSVNGSSGCNRFFGGFTLDGTLITFDALAGTMMMCDDAAMGVEQAFLGALQGEALYQISGDRLELITGVGTLTFAGEAPIAEEAGTAEGGAAFFGTTWALQSFDDTMGVELDPAVVEATITFADDGSVFGKSGCNNFSGGYALDGTIVTFGAMAGTMMMCDEPAATVEMTMLQALQGEAQVQITGSTMELITGVGTLTFVAQ